jgi:2-amino-4-hydroxy-6-hydroxymethyldihydropteridine diphosphokinase
MPHVVYISLGSNVGDREAQLRDAQARLAAAGRVVGASSLYETEPVEFTEQPWFLNFAMVLETSKTPQQLMAAILHIEEEMGRRRVQKKGPRPIDIDILLFDEVIINSTSLDSVDRDSANRDSTNLTIPHPALHERRFVLEPLAEIAPEVLHPVLKKTIRELRDALPPGQAVRKLRKT